MALKGSSPPFSHLPVKSCAAQQFLGSVRLHSWGLAVPGVEGRLIVRLDHDALAWAFLG